MENYLTGIFSYLLTQSWQIAVLVAIIAVVTFALKNRSAHIRYLLWLIVLAKCLVPPILSLPLAVLPEDTPVFLENSLPLERGIARQIIPPTQIQPVTTREVIPIPERTIKLTRPQLLALFWLAGSIIFLLAAIIKAIKTNRWLKGSRRALPAKLQSNIEESLAELKLKKFPKLWFVDGIGQPFVWGLIRGSIYLPSDFAKLNDNEYRKDILSHEISHVLRFDAAINTLQIIAQAIFWFHPFVWWTNKKIRTEREKCCDEMAISRIGAKPKDYSTAIVNVLITEHKATRPVPSLAVAGPVKNIEDRVKIILKAGKKFYKRPSLMTATIVLLLALITVPTALVLTTRAETEAIAQSDQDVLQGVWIGHELGAEGGKCKITISGNQVRFRAERGEWYEGTFTLQERAELKQLDFIIEDCSVPTVIGKTSRAIYKVENKTLTFVANAPGEETRPTSFEESSGGRVFVLTKDQALQANPTLSLHDAAAAGDLEEVELHISMGTDVNAKDQKSRTALHRAAHSGHIEVVRVLLENGADVNAEDNLKRTPLEHAVRASYTEVVKLLIEKGANPNDRNEDDETPLHVAATSARKDTVEALVDNGADVTVKDGEGFTPIYSAMMSPFPGRREIVELILATGKEPSTVYLAAYLGDLDEVKTFIKKGAGVNKKGPADGTALHFAAAGGQKEVMEFLLDRGADVNARAMYGLTPLHAVVLCANDKEAIDLLIANGADVNALANVEGEMGMTILGTRLLKCLIQVGEFAKANDMSEEVAIERIKSLWNSEITQLLLSKGAKLSDGDSMWLSLAADIGIPDVVKLAVTQGVDVNAKQPDGSTLLHYAAGSGQKELVEQLIAKGADVNAKDTEGYTALYEAASEGHTEIVELLIAKGADINTQLDINTENNGLWTPLQAAANQDHTSVVELLISKGANVNIKDKWGFSSLHTAAKDGRNNVAEILIAGGADINSRNQWEQTPLHIAAKRGHKRVAELLIDKGAEVNAKDKWDQTPLGTAVNRGHTEIAELLRKHGAEE